MTRDELIAKSQAVLERDPRVRAMWLAGSLGRGDADAYSDVDLLVAVAEEALPSVLAEAEQILRRVASLVLFRQVVPGAPVFSTITDEWLRLDLVIVKPADVAHRARTSVRALFDRDGLSASLREGADPFRPSGSGSRIVALAEEFLRVLGLLVTIAGREEWSQGVIGGGLLRGHLSSLLLEEAQVADPGGALRLYALLDPEQRDVLAGLPAIAATRSSVIDFSVACAEAFLPRARALARDRGASWPAGLESSTLAHLRRNLDVRIAEGNS